MEPNELVELNKITETIQSDSFITPEQKTELNLNEVIHNIKRNLEYKDAQALDIGLQYYKTDVTSEKLYIKTLLQMLCECSIRNVKTSDIQLEQKESIIQNIQQTTKGLEQLIVSNYDLMVSINKGKGLFDVKELSLMLLGFALKATKKIGNS